MSNLEEKVMVNAKHINEVIQVVKGVIELNKILTERVIKLEKKNEQVIS